MSDKQMNKKKSKKKHKKSKFKIVLLILLLILIIAGGVFAYKTIENGGGISGVMATILGHNKETKKNLSEFKVLILGVSTDLDSELTDTIMVASYNPNTQKATLLSIPRDTNTNVNPDKGTASDKINALYNKTRKADETLEAVNRITGLNIKNYMVVKTKALIKLVDAIGGVKYNVPIDMNYDDTTQNLHINLKAGEQMIDGAKAEQLLRFRHNNDNTSYPVEYGDNDEGRMRTQREFTMQVLKQTLKPENIFKIGQILDIANENVITNINISEAKDYIPYAVEFNTDNLITGVLPGENVYLKSTKVWVFKHDEEKSKKLIKELFYDRDLTEEEKNNGSVVTKSDIKIEVLNASGDSKKLQKAVNELEGAGYKVTRTGTATTTTKTTIANKKDIQEYLLKNIKEVIKAGSISNEKDASSKVDVTITIGKDY